MANLIATGGYSVKNVFDGDPAKNYKLYVDNTAIIKDNLNKTVFPSKVAISSMEASGSGDPAPFGGYFKIFRRTNAGMTRAEYDALLAQGLVDPNSEYIIGETSNLLIEVYRSTSPESSTNYTVEYSEDSTALYVYLYKDSGFQTLLDITTISITADGTKVKEVVIEYKIDTQGANPPQSGWSKDIPNPAPGKFLWTRITTTFDDGTSSVSYSVGGFGTSGVNARTVQLSSPTTAVAYNELGKNPNLSSVAITATSLNTEGTPYYEFLLNGKLEKNTTSSAYTYSVPADFSGATATIEVRLREGNTTSTVLAKDILTISQIKPGQDAYTVMLSNESHTFPGSEDAAIDGSTSTRVIAYKGVVPMKTKVGTISGKPAKGMDIVVADNDSLITQINITVTPELVVHGGELTIPVTVDGKSFEKKMTFAVSRKGVAGNDGRSVRSVDVEFASSSDNKTAPKTGWTTDAPAWEQGKYIWSRTRTTYSVGQDTTSAETCISGSPGNTGKGILSIKEQYNLSSSNKSADGTWVDTMPNFLSGRFIWTRMLITWTDNTVTPTDAVLANAINDANQRAIDAETQMQLKAPFIVGTQTAATSAWTGVAPFSTLESGQQITYLLNQAPSGSATLNLTLADGKTTGAINAYYGGTRRLTTHYGQGSVIRLTYLVDNKIGSTNYAGWWADANYTDGNTYDRVQYARAIKAKTAIAAGQMIGSDSAGFFKLAAGTTIMLDKPILYAASAIAIGATGTGNYTVYSTVTLSTTFPITGLGLAAYDVVYLKGELTGLDFKIDSTMPITKTPTDDGSEYMLLGQMSTTTSMSLYGTHDLYTFHEGVFKSFAQIAAETSILAKSAVISADQEYAVVDSPTDSSKAVWKTTADIPAPKQYLWSRTKLTLADGTVKYKPSTNGTNISGAQGADGRSITSVVEEYYLSSSPTAQKDGSWGTTSPTWKDGWYIWTKTTMTYSNGDTSVFGPTNVTGARGGQGLPGGDAISINLSKESYVFAGDTSEAIAGQSTTIVVTALKGNAAANVSIGTIGGIPANMLVEKPTGSVSEATIKVTTNSGMSTKSGNLTIPITVDSKTFIRNFAYALALQGTDGVSITSVTVLYYLSTKSDSVTGGTGWSATPPAWKDGWYMWSKTRTEYSNEDFTETKPVCITGAAGSAGRGIKKITQQYYLSTRKDILQGGTWKDSPDPWVPGKWMWTRSRIEYTTGDPAIGYTTEVLSSEWEALDAGLEIGAMQNLSLSMKQIEVGYENLNKQAEGITSTPDITAAKVNNETKFNALKSAYTTIMSDGKVTQTELNSYETGLAEYKNTASILQKLIMEAIDGKIRHLVERADTVDLSLTADAIIAKVVATETWTELGTSIDEKISKSESLSRQTFEGFSRTVTSSIQDMNESIATKTRYFSETMDGLEIGLSTSPFKTRIDEEKMSFFNNAVELAHFRYNQMYVENIIATRTLQMGEHKFESYPGNLTIARWVGPT